MRVAMQPNVRRVEKNGVGYTVVLERSLWSVPVPEGRPALPGQRFTVLPYENAVVESSTPPEIVKGVILTDYRVHRDDDPTWRAWVTLGGDPPMGNEHEVIPARVYVAKVEVLAGRHGLTTTALPIADLLNACVRCGEVGMRRNAQGTYDFIPDDEGLPMPAAQVAQLTGRKGRRTDNTPDRDAQILRLCDAHAALKAEWRTDKSTAKPQPQAAYVAAALNLSPHTAKELIAVARRRAGLTKKASRTKGDSK